jgi:CTP synthase
MTRCCPGARVAEVYGTTAIEERHRHRYEVDIKYRDALEEKGLRVFRHVARRPPARDRRMVADHPWFIGVQFHPELKSKPFEPHPLFADFVRAANGVTY